MAKTKSQGAEVLSGWKNIATYLGRSLRTVQRYESQLGLPVHRRTGDSLVITTKRELDTWIAASPTREPMRKPVARPLNTVDHHAMLNELRRHIDELHRLREEAKELREAVNGSVQSLRSKLDSAAAKPRHERRRLDCPPITDASGDILFSQYTAPIQATHHRKFKNNPGTGLQNQ